MYRTPLTILSLQDLTYVARLDHLQNKILTVANITKKAF